MGFKELIFVVLKYFTLLQIRFKMWHKMIEIIKIGFIEIYLNIWSTLYYFYMYLWAISYQFNLDLPSLTLICPIGHFFRFSSIKLVSHIKMRISISGIRGCVNKNAKILNMNFRVNLSNYEGWLFVLLVLWNLHAIYRVLQKKFRI